MPSRKKQTASINDYGSYGRIPPHAEELERYILGACMIEREAFSFVSEMLIPEAFYLQQHQTIYACMYEMHVIGKVIDIGTVVEHLMAKGQLEEVGGPYYITRLTNEVVSTAHLEQHAQIVIQYYVARCTIVQCHEAILRAYEKTDCYDNINVLYTELDKAQQQGEMTTSVSMLQGTMEMISEMDKIRKSKNEITGVPSCYRELDNLTYGWQPTDLIILAARPSVGKTAFALNLARNAASHPTRPTPVAFFSLEMGRKQLIQRIYAMEGKIDMQAIMRGQLTDDQYDQFMKDTVVTAERYPIYIDDTAGLSWMELRTKLRRMKRKYGIRIAIIDYLQLMNDVADGEKRNREQQISKISREIKKLAKELNIPIIALSQLSRAIETRGGDKIPQLSDLRESGALEQDADMVMFLYKPAYYEVKEADPPLSKGETHVKIAKHRNGSLETVKLIANLSIQKFWDYDDQEARTYSREWKPVYGPDLFGTSGGVFEKNEEDAW